MNRKFLIFVLVALFGGICLGYVLQYLTATKDAASELSKKGNTSPLPRFGRTVISNQEAGATHTKRKKILLKDEDLYLFRVAKMDADGIQAEIDRIIKSAKNISELDVFDQLLLHFLFSRLGQTAPRQALSQLKHTPHLYSFYGGIIISAWVERNPEAVMVYCQEQGGDGFNYAYYDIMEQISPEKAMEWIKELPQQEKENAVHGLFFAAFKSHPERIAELIQKAGELVSLDSYLKNTIAEKWIVVDKAATMKWIDSLPEEEQIEPRANALKELPLEEATAAITALEGKAKEETVIQIANYLSEKSALQAVEWLMTHSDFDLKSWENIVSSAYYINSHYNEPELKSYITHLPAGDKKDVFLERMVDELRVSRSDLVENDMNEVLSMASQIGNAEKRTLSIESALYTWMGVSPDEARQWIEKSDFSPEKKEDLLKRCDSYARSEDE